MGFAFILFMALLALIVAAVFVWGGVKELVQVSTKVWHSLSTN